MSQYTATHCSCAQLENLLALTNTIFKVIQRSTHLPQCFTQTAATFQGVLMFSGSVPKASGWEQDTSCDEICSHHSSSRLCTANGWWSLNQPAGATPVNATGVLRDTVLGRLQPLHIANTAPVATHAVLQAKTSVCCSHLLSSPCTWSLLISSDTYCGRKTAGATEQTQPPKSKAVHGCLKLCFLRQCTTLLHLLQPVISNHIHCYIALLSVILWNYSLKPKARGFLGRKIKEQWNDVSRSQSKTDARGGKPWQHNTDYHYCYSEHQLSVRIQMSKEEKRKKTQLGCICLPVRGQWSVSALCGIPAKVTSCACCQTAASAECSLLGDNWNVACRYLITV